MLRRHANDPIVFSHVCPSTHVSWFSAHSFMSTSHTYYRYVIHIYRWRHGHLFCCLAGHSHTRIKLESTLVESKPPPTPENVEKCPSRKFENCNNKKTILNPAAEFFHIIWFRPIYNFLRYSVHRQRDKQTNTRRWSQYFANLAGRGVDYSWKTDLKPLLWWIKIYIYWRIIVRFSLRLVDFILKNSISMFITLGLK